eukprot:gene6498-6998_t
MNSHVPQLLKNFKVCWMLYFIITSIVFGCFISVGSHFPYIDGIFLGASAMTGAGLSTYPMYDLHLSGFILTAILMIIGNSCFTLLPTILYRRYCFKQINEKMIENYQKQHRTIPLHANNLKTIEESYLIYESLYMLTNIILLYYALWMIFGIIGIYCALLPYPLQQELVDRGASYLDSATYVAVSAFANTGLTMSSDSLLGIDNNPPCYLIISTLILAGNTALPILLRSLISFLYYLNQQPWIQQYFPEEEKQSRFSITQPYKYYYNRNIILLYILNHPRKLTTHLFHSAETNLLSFMVLILIIIQYLSFIFSILYDSPLLETYSISQLLAIGFFQTLSTRSAGFAMMDLRLLNQGLLLIYCIMMYIAAFPFVTTLYATNTQYERQQHQIIYEEDVEEKGGTTLLLDDEGVEKEGKETFNNDDDNKMLKEMEENLMKEMKQDHKQSKEGIKTMIKDLSKTVQGNVHTFIHNISMTNNPTTNSDHHRYDHVGGREVEDSQASELEEDTREVEIMNILQLKEKPREDRLRSISSITMDVELKSHVNTGYYTPSKQDKDEETNKDMNKKIEEDQSFVKTNNNNPNTATTTANNNNTNTISFHQQFAKRYFLRHTFFLLFTLILLAYTEDGLVRNPVYEVNLFYILFEMISAYGAVGLTLGIPGKSYSLSGQMSNFGKHRGLPNQDDEVIDFTFEKFQLAYVNGDGEDSSVPSHENEKSEESHFLQVKQ